MNKEELSKKVWESLKGSKTKAKKFQDDVLVSFTLISEDPDDNLYVIVKDGELNVEPHRYNDNNCEAEATAETIAKLFAGELSFDKALKDGLVKTNNADKLKALECLVPSKKAASKTADKKTAAKKTTTKTAEKKAPAKKAAAKPAEKKAPAKKAAAKPAEKKAAPAKAAAPAAKPAAPAAKAAAPAAKPAAPAAKPAAPAAKTAAPAAKPAAPAAKPAAPAAKPATPAAKPVAPASPIKKK